MATIVTYVFYVRVDAPAGWMAEEKRIDAEFQTDDHDHALELAERQWESIKPVNYLDGTLAIV